MKLYTYERIAFHAALKEARKRARMQNPYAMWAQYTEMYEKTLLLPSAA